MSAYAYAYAYALVETSLKENMQFACCYPENYSKHLVELVSTVRYCFFQHMFRIPEKRPPKAVSTAFTVLIFLPLVIMLIVVSIVHCV